MKAKANPASRSCCLVDSSPRSAATAGSVGGLRRYSSCGYQWPTSRKKRKQNRPPLSAYIPELEAVESGYRTSKVSLLLEEATRLKETERQMFDDEDQPRAPSSSSPLPLASRLMDDVDDESPSRKAPLTTAACQTQSERTRRRECIFKD